MCIIISRQVLTIKNNMIKLQMKELQFNRWEKK